MPEGTEKENVTTIVVPIRYPPKAASVRTLKRAIDLADGCESPHLYVFHVNLIHKGEHVERSDLARAVTREVGSIANASYHVRNAFLLEEAILYEAVQQDADYVIIGTDTKAKWRQLLADRLGVDVNLEDFLKRHLTAALIVV